MNIIVVDDEPMLIKIFKSYLKINGHDVATFQKYEGLNIGGNVDLYMLDHDIKGGITGYEWLKQVGEENIPPNKRIMMSGANSWFEHNLKGYYLMKPFDMSTLNNIIKKIEYDK